MLDVCPRHLSDFLYYSFILILASAFLLQSTTFFFSQSHGSAHHTSLHHTTSQNTPTVPPSPPSCCLLAHTPFASAVFFFFCLFFCLATLNSTQVLQSSLCALSISALSSILFILLHYPIWSIPTTLTFSVLLKLGSNPLPPLLNSWTAHLHTTPWSALPVMAPARSRLLVVTQLLLSVNHSHSSPPLFQIFHQSNHLLSLCNFLIRRYQSSISVILHLHPLILNHCLSSSMTSVLFCLSLQPHLMNSSSPATLTFISIILQTLSPLSFCLWLVDASCDFQHCLVTRAAHHGWMPSTASLLMC